MSLLYTICRKKSIVSGAWPGLGAEVLQKLQEFARGADRDPALQEQPEYIYTRHDRRAPRGKQEIGISAVRGGTIVGEHEIIFAGTDEVIEIKHTAYSKAIFGKGAVAAAKFLAGKGPGLYNMQDAIDME